MNQKKLCNLISGYIDRELPPEETYQVLHEIHTNPIAHGIYHQLKDVTSLLNDVDQPHEVDRYFTESLLNKLHQENYKPSFFNRFVIPALPKLALTGGTVSLALIAVYLFTFLFNATSKDITTGPTVLSPPVKITDISQLEINFEKESIKFMGKDTGRNMKEISFQAVPEVQANLFKIEQLLLQFTDEPSVTPKKPIDEAPVYTPNNMLPVTESETK